jgi:hypothetical protein
LGFVKAEKQSQKIQAINEFLTVYPQDRYGTGEMRTK